MCALHFPTLFVTAEIGRQKSWKVWVEGDCYYRQDCFVQGKQKKPVCRQCKATNVGRANEKTAPEQARLKAATAWVKILDKGYKPDPSDQQGTDLYNQIWPYKQQGSTSHKLPDLLLDLMAGKTPEPVPQLMPLVVPLTTVKPMLAQQLQPKKCQPDKELWFMQPKLDGVRCVAHTKERQVILMSRTGKQFSHLQHVRQDILDLTQKLGRSVILDGELFARSLTVGGKAADSSQMFSLITGACRATRTEPADYEQQIEYHIYDIVDLAAQQTDRLQQLEKIKQLLPVNTCLKIVETTVASSMPAVKDYLAEVLARGYEGVILRKGDALYQQKRTTSLLKYKLFQDSEFTIVGAKQGNGTEQGCIVWRCQTADGQEFDVRPRGSFESRRELWQCHEKYIGQQLTVRYQEMSADGIPRFPVGITVRDYE